MPRSTRSSVPGPLARAAAAVVQEGRAVHADADVDVVPADQKSHQSVVDQGGVGLERLGDLDAVAVVALRAAPRRWS